MAVLFTGIKTLDFRAEMVIIMASYWLDSVSQETAVELAWEEMGGYWNCESGARAENYS